MILNVTKVLFWFFISFNAYADHIDERLESYFENFLIKPPQTILNKRPKLYEFGKSLFNDKDLSLNKNISCSTCHIPELGTVDALALSIGEGGEGTHLLRRQMRAGITSRNAPHLFNKADPSFKALFWDGRVSLNSRTGVYETPEPGLNGENPEYYEIVDKVENLLAMQSLFPIVNHIEMRGSNFNHLDNHSVWKKVSNLIRAKKKYQDYISDDFNIADIANALSYYQKIEFQVNDTPMDRFIKGNRSSLSLTEKKGALVFFEKGRCSRCHLGPLLTNRSFQSVSAPQIGPGLNSKNNDEGRYLVTKNENHKYEFLTQPLRNIAITAPFYHNGAYASLREVIDHYDNPSKAIHNYDVTQLERLYSLNYNEMIFVDRNHYNNFYRVQSLNNILKTPLRLSEQDKSSLICFLKKSLTQEKYHHLIDMNECDR